MHISAYSLTTMTNHSQLGKMLQLCYPEATMPSLERCAMLNWVPAGQILTEQKMKKPSVSVLKPGAYNTIAETVIKN